MSKKHYLGKLADFTIGQARSFRVENENIAVFCLAAGKLYAIEDRCPHANVPLNDGCLEGHEVICLWHSWAFDVRTGQSTTHPGINIKTYTLIIENDEIFLEI